MRHFNINTDVDDNNNNANDDDDTYDGKIRDKTSDIRYLVDWVIQQLLMIERKLKKSFMK